MSASENCTTVHRCLQRSPHHIWSASASQHPTLPTPPTLCKALSSHNVRPSGLLCCRPYGLEHTSRRPSRTGIATTYFQSRTENSAVLILLAHQRLDCNDTLYKFKIDIDIDKHTLQQVLCFKLLTDYTEA